MTSRKNQPENSGSLNPIRFILIVGPKHSGKTQSSRALQKATGWETVDLDELVEKQTGKSPRELYKEGPEIFRKAEARALAGLINIYKEGKHSLIVAAGGGIVDNPDAITLLSRHNEIIPVYLDISAGIAWQRILASAKDGELPPFLNTGNPKETHLVLHKRRAGAYKAMARITISAENKSPEEIAREITASLEIQ